MLSLQRFNTSCFRCSRIAAAAAAAAAGGSRSSAAADAAAAAASDGGVGAVSSGAGDASFFVSGPAEALESLRDSAELLLNNLGEPTFASLGLGVTWFPNSFVLNFLETMHVTVGLPWWLCIFGIGVSVRLSMILPTMLMQRFSRVDVPKLSKINDYNSRINLAMKTQNHSLIMRLSTMANEEFPEMRNPTKAKNSMIFKAMSTVTSFAVATFLVQLPSIRALYKAAAVPVPSFQSGGLLWFSDLTCIDPYFILPAVITGFLMLNLRHHWRNSPQKGMFGAVQPLAFTLLPIVVFSLLINFPCATLVYFLTTGCTAQLLHLANNSEQGKRFWKKAIGLPSHDQVQHVELFSKAIEDRVKQTIEESEARNQKIAYDYVMMSESVKDGKRRKTYRIKKAKSGMDGGGGGGGDLL